MLRAESAVDLDFGFRLDRESRRDALRSSG